MNQQTKHGGRFSFLNSYIKGEALLGGWGLVGTGLTFVNTFLLVSFLDVFNYGVYILVIAFFSLVSNLSISLLQGVILNDVARFVGSGEEARAKRLFLENTVLQLGTALLFSVLTFLGAGLVASWYDEDIASLIRITSPIFLISTFYTTMRMLFSVRLRFAILASRSIMYKIFRLVFLGAFILFGSFSVKYALVAHVGASFLSMLVCVPSFIRVYAPWKRLKAAREHILWRITKSYGKWSLLGEGFKSTTLDLRPWLVKLFIDTEAVAVYSIAESLYGVIKDFVPTGTLKLLFPRMVSDSKRTMRVLLKSIKYLVFYSILLGILAAIVVPLLIFFFLPHYVGSIPLFLVILLALPLLAFRSPTTAFLVAGRRQRFIYARATIAFVSALVVPLILLPLLGVIGMALERVVTAVMASLATFWYLSRHDISLSAWRSVFKFNKGDRVFLSRLVRLFRGWLRRKIRR